MKKFLMASVCMALIASSCKKDKDDNPRGYKYYEVGFRVENKDWRDTAFIVATNDTALIRIIENDLTLPLNKKQIVNGGLEKGSAGYNKNASHEFKWHFKENDWKLTDMSIEIYDGKPFTDIDQHYGYWMDTVKRFSPWSSFIRREVKR